MKFKIFGMDTETFLDFEQMKHVPLSVQFYSEFHQSDIYYVYKPSEVERLKQDIKKYVYGSVIGVFNGWFDVLVISHVLKDTDARISIVSASSRFIKASISYNKKSCTIIDLKNVFSVSNLSELGKLVGIEKLEKPEGLGLPTIIKKIEENPEFRKRFEEYAMTDAKICYHAMLLALDRLYGYVRNRRQVKATISAIAIRKFFEHVEQAYPRFVVDFPTFNETLERFLRKSYRGGRCEAFIRGTLHGSVRYYDVNSLYPYVMASFEYPVISRDPFFYFKIKSDVDLDNEGIAFAEVFTDSDLSPLGIRHRCYDGYTRLVFPKGRFAGFFTYPELRALEQDGGKIVRVIKTVEWKHRFNPFRDLITEWYQERLRAKREGNKELSHMYKILMNSLYGKFGEYKASKLITIVQGKVREIRELRGKRRRYANVVWASYITAYARLVLYGYLKRVPYRQILYCDTDSIITTHSLDAHVGEWMGQLKKEFEANEALIIRSKFYLLDDWLRLKGCSRILPSQEMIKLIKLRVAHGKVVLEQTEILKLLKAMRLLRKPLEQIEFAKEFSINEDGKRKYLKYLSGKELLETFTYSEALPLYNKSLV